MPHRHGPALSNPMIGVYFGILAASLAAIVMMLLIFEQMGIPGGTLRAILTFGSMALFALVGAGAYTSRMRDFANAGRRVPAFYNGLALTIATFGATGLAGISGALFIAGFDMLFLGLGLVAGLTAMIMLVAPFLRKFGAPTVPAYLGQRFDSGAVRLTAASVAVVPLLLVLIAEIKMALLAASWLVPLAPAAAATAIVAALVVTVVPGGARSVAWSSAAKALAVLVAVLVPAAIAAVMETNLPFGQLSHGPLLRQVGRLEAAQDVPVPIAGLLTFDLPGQGLQPIAGRFATTFGSVGPLAFVLGTLSILAGIAGSPALLARSAATPSVYETRKSIGWAVVLVGVLLMTFSAIAVFERNILMSGIVGQATQRAPAAVRALLDLGLAGIDPQQARIKATSLAIGRDATLVALPVLLEMPGVVVSLVATGILAAALAGAAASLAQLGLILGEDVINAPASWRASDFHRLTTCRIAIALVAAAGGIVAVTAHGDPLVLVLSALALAGSALFPVLVLSVWWKRVNAAGAVAGLVAGFSVGLAVIAASALAGFGLPGALAPVLGVPAAAAAAAIVSQLTPAPGRHILESVRDLRVPGGETVHDRELRQARQRGADGR
jgi:cation/acetate symporter